MTLSKKRQDMIQAAKLYYYGNMSQEAIAELLHISRPKVSRLLAEARQLNIVKISIHETNLSFQRNEETLKEHFNLKYVCIVPSGNNEDIAKQNVGKAAADFLNEHINDHSRIGLSWGTTLAAFVQNFKSKTPMPDALVMQLVGGTYSKNLNEDGRQLVDILAQKLQCRHSILQAPLMVTNPMLRDLLMQEPTVMEHFKQIKQLDIAFVGMGYSFFNYRDTIAYRTRCIGDDEARRLFELGLVCDVCGHPLLPDGTEPETFLTNRMIGITLEELNNIPLVVGVCVGHKKMRATLAALKGHHVNALIIDEVLAIALLAEEGLEST